MTTGPKDADPRKVDPKQGVTDKLERLPRTPGVYLFKDQDATVIYIGKAKNLRSRVRSYFTRSADPRLAVRFIEKHVRDLEVIQTRNEKEAFLLENNLIKKMRPRYNIRLRDDKNFLHLRLDRAHPFPAFVTVRRPRKDGARYFGPYASAGAIRNTLRLIRSFLPLRDCSDRELEIRTRPCLKHQIKLCSAPCTGEISQEDYAALVSEAEEILQGRTGELIEKLREAMGRASEALEFEKAAALRDQIAFLETSTAGQAVEASRLYDLDAVGFYREGGLMEMAVLFFRAGKLVGASPFSFDAELPPDEALSEFLWQFYGAGSRPIPEEILVPEGIYGLEPLQEMLTERREARVVLMTPQRGDRVRFLEMAKENARLSLQVANDRRRLRLDVLVNLKERLGLRDIPRTIECCDISTTQGDSAVGSVVRFEDGEPDKNYYRRYRIQSVEGQDDYAMMREVLIRRLKRGGELPDLMVVDGGKGQLTSAMDAWQHAGKPNLEWAAMAKAPRRGGGVALRVGEEERIFRPGRTAPIPLDPTSEECFLLQRIRDEAHRFAIEYHRKRRGKKSLGSVLDDVRGLGAVRRKRILGYFGGKKRLLAASEEEIASVPGVGPKLASAIYATLHRVQSSER